MSSDLIDVDEWTEVITVPDDGDEYLAASVEGAFQGLTNRTRNVKAILDELINDGITRLDTLTRKWNAIQRFAAGAFNNGDFGVTGEVLYVGAEGPVETRVRMVCVPPSRGVARPGSAASYGASHLWTVTGAGGVVYPLSIPRGAVITRVQPVLQRGAGGGSVFFTASLTSLTPNFAGGLPAVDVIGTATVLLADSAWWTTDSDLASMPAIDNANCSYLLDVGGNDTHTQGGVRVTYLDPGPRNG